MLSGFLTSRSMRAVRVYRAGPSGLAELRIAVHVESV